MGSAGAAGSATVRVVTINWNAAELTARCLRSLLATEWPEDRLDIVVVDNASIDGSLERLRAWFADEPVRFVANPHNVGFAEGCNVAMRDLHGVDHLALVNNDAVVEPGWLAPLVRALDDDPGLGAVAPKLLLANPYSELLVDAAPGAEVVAVEVDGLDVTGRCLWGPGVETVPDRSVPLLLRHHVGPRSTVAVPVPADPGRTITATVSLRTDQRFHVDGGDGAAQGSSPSGELARATVAVTAAATWRVNSLGTGRTPWNEGIELAFGEPDDPSAGGEEPLGWCGGGVLLRGDYLRDVGGFDPRFFAYYEDTDLSWRGRRAGWRYRTEPRSVLHHLHGGSAGSTARGFFLLNYRNWLLTALRNGDRQEIAVTLRWARQAAWGATYLNVVDPLRQRRRPRWTLPAAWAAVALTTAASAPRVLLSRRAGRGRRIGTTPTRRVRSLLQARPSPRPPAPRLGGPAVVYLDTTAALGPHGDNDDHRLTSELLRFLPLVADVDAVGVTCSEADGAYRRLSSEEWARVLSPPGPGHLAPSPGPAAIRHTPTVARRLVLPRWERGAVFVDVRSSGDVAGDDRHALLPQLRASGVRVVWVALGDDAAASAAHLDHADAVLCTSADAAARLRSLRLERRPDRPPAVSVCDPHDSMSAQRLADAVADQVRGLDHLGRPA